ncbi:MAG: hypothetical protein Q4C47_02515 [Planctomycetia bacterium]|nr:hypothetical protein [Planctomycetia bacterium]
MESQCGDAGTVRGAQNTPNDGSSETEGEVGAALKRQRDGGGRCDGWR